ncbi:MAG: outer membrane lipoprotein-sorting protein [Flavobacteriia bacterium]|jgi:outer membrane lipoprotein-sorting protein
MKKVALFIAFIGLSALSFGQTAEEIINKYFETLGGKEKMNAIQTMEMKAKVDFGGMSIPLQIVSMRDGRQFTKFSFQGKEMTQGAFDGTTAWGTNFMTMKAEKEDAETTENIKRSVGDFVSPFINYSDKGYTVELLPNETIEGVECFKLKLTKKPQMIDGKEVPNVEFYYMDKDNYVPIVVETEINQGEMKGQISQTVFSDYQEVEGTYFAFSMTQRLKDGMGQTIVIESVELNKTYEDSLFKFPEE